MSRLSEATIGTRIWARLSSLATDRAGASAIHPILMGTVAAVGLFIGVGLVSGSFDRTVDVVMTNVESVGRGAIGGVVEFGGDVMKSVYGRL